MKKIMKKTVFFLAVILFLNNAQYVRAYDATWVIDSATSSTFTTIVFDNGSDRFSTYDVTTDSLDNSGYTPPPSINTIHNTDLTGFGGLDDEYAILYDPGSVCTAGMLTYSQCLLAGGTEVASTTLSGGLFVGFPPPPPPPPPPPFEEIFGSIGSTSTSSIAVLSIVDNPTQDFFMGVILFYVSAGFVIWIFKKKN